MGAPVSRTRDSSEATGTGASNGFFVQISATTAVGAQTIDAPDHAIPFVDDEYSTDPPLSVVTLIAVNTDTLDHTLNIQWGGGTSTATLFTRTITAGKGAVIVLDRELIQLGSTITAWASSANVINVKMTKWPYTS